MEIISQYHIKYTNLKIITKQVPKGKISSYPDLNGRAMTYYLGTTMPQSYMDRHENTISYLIISHYICACIIQSPKDKIAQAHGPKPLCVLRRVPKACISSISYVSQYMSVSHICISIIIIPHAYAPKKQKRQNTRPKISMCVQIGPKCLLSHLYHCIWREGYCPMILKTISILIFMYILIIL